MVTRIVRLTLLFLLIGLAVTVVVFNSHPISIVYLPGKTTGPVMTGVALLATFCAGITVAVLFSIIYGVKAYFRERSLKSKDAKRAEFYDLMLEARSALAAKEFDRAQDLWERLIHRDPTSIIARVELSRSLQQAGRVREALKVLDKARAVDPHNPEVLLRAADLNVALDNKTAAVDNLALLVYDHPSLHAAKLARDLSEELDRVEDALEYHRRFTELGGRDQEAGRRLEFEGIMTREKDPEVQLAQLRKFAKKHPEYSPALSRLSELEASSGNIEKAAELLLKAAKQSDSRKYWLQATRLWLENDQGERAVAAAKTAARNVTGKARVDAELDLARLYLETHQATEAKSLLSGLVELAKAEKASLSREQSRRYLTLKGHCLNQLGDYQEAAEIWQKLSDEDDASPRAVASQAPHRSNGTPKNGSAPSPVLSTP